MVTEKMLENMRDFTSKLLTEQQKQEYVTDPEDIKKAMFDEMSEMSDEVILAYAKDFGVSVTDSCTALHEIETLPGKSGIVNSVKVGNTNLHIIKC